MPVLQAAATVAYLLVVPKLWYEHVPYLSVWPLSLIAFLAALLVGARASRSRLPRIAAEPRTSRRLAAALGPLAALLVLILTGDRLPWWRYALAAPLFAAIIELAFAANRRVSPLAGWRRRAASTAAYGGLLACTILVAYECMTRPGLQPSDVPVAAGLGVVEGVIGAIWPMRRRRPARADGQAADYDAAVPGG